MGVIAPWTPRLEAIAGFLALADAHRDPDAAHRNTRKALDALGVTAAEIELAEAGPTEAAETAYLGRSSSSSGWPRLGERGASTVLGPIRSNPMAGCSLRRAR